MVASSLIYHVFAHRLPELPQEVSRRCCRSILAGVFGDGSTISITVLVVQTTILPSHGYSSLYAHDLVVGSCNLLGRCSLKKGPSLVKKTVDACYVL